MEVFAVSFTAKVVLTDPHHSSAGFPRSITHVFLKKKKSEDTEVISLQCQYYTNSHIRSDQWFIYSCILFHTLYTDLQKELLHRFIQGHYNNGQFRFFTGAVYWPFST